MKYNYLGNSELSVSEYSFGCMSLNENQSQNTSLLLQAFDAGINFFDTADLYDNGWNEETVGTALKSIRNKVIIATKVGNQPLRNGSGWCWNPTKKYILEAVEKSLSRLKTDYIDLYQLHGGTIDDPIDDTIEAFELLKEQGKIREYGISSIRPNVIKKWVEKSNLISVMMQYSILDRRPEEVCLDLLYSNEVSVITRGSLAKGMLIDKAVTAYLDYSEEEVQLVQDSLRRAKNSISASLQFILKHPAVATSVTGIRNKEQLEALIKASLVSISDKSLIKLSKILRPKFYTNHR